MKQKVIAVVGPTASGKTKLAIQFAKDLDGEVVSADSRLIYKGFDIAAAKPSVVEQAGVPHHMMDIVSPEHDYSVGEYCDDAREAIYNILSRGRIPVIAGGTGLYIRVLLENYNIPRVAPDYRFRKELDELEKAELLSKLYALDRITYERLKDSNKRRIIRALEVIKGLGKPISETDIVKEPEFDVEWYVPRMDSREELYERINKRVDIMVEQGIIEETDLLLERHGRIKNLVSTIGYKEIISYMDGECSLDEALDNLKQHTRNYAKRQLTWFRKNPNLNIKI